MSRLALYLLGSPRVSVDGASVEIRRRKVLALLAYLAVTAQCHSRDELAELLYGRRDRGHARASLRQTISLLRRAVGAERVGATRLQVWLPAGRDVWIDVAEFRRLIESAQAADAQRDLPTVKDHLAKAISLFRGDFLSGFYTRDSVDFENWQLLVQENLRQQQISALQRLMDIHGASGDYDEAIGYGRSKLTLEPLDEDTHRQLMRFQSLAGRYLGALRQYERCRSVFERELGEKPGEETERLREQIASRRFPGGADSGRENPQYTPGWQDARPLLGTRLLLFAEVAATGGGQAPDREARCREAIAQERGRILATSGRMLCAGFRTVDGAIRAGLCAQSRAAAPGGALRMVLLAGETAGVRAPSGELIKQAAILLDAAYEGQVLLNEPAARLAGGGELPLGTTIHAIGTHRLKDLGPARCIYLLEHPDLPHDLRGLDTLDSVPNNLRTQPTGFIGRATELSALQKSLGLGEIRLLTLTGAAGTGKTRLALQAAAGLHRCFPQGLFFVDLAPLRNPELVPSAIAAALGIRESGGEARTPFETIEDYLRNKRLLLLLDNFEHLLKAAPQVGDLLDSCPRLKILATSREPLKLRAERVFFVPPMQLSRQGKSMAATRSSDAVRLFAERATAACSTFTVDETNVEVVAEICRKLDGLPLAIELAASRVGTLPVEMLLGKLKTRLKLLKGGPRDLPGRQKTLRSAIDWSYELLLPRERRTFSRLSVFPAGCTLESAEAVCSVEGDVEAVYSDLASLTEKSLLRLANSPGGSRYRMLETVREYALERLKESDGSEVLEARFAAHFLRFAEQTERELYGPNQARQFARIEDERGNLQAALSWMYERQELANGLRLAGALGWFWFRRAHFSEGQHWLEAFRAAAREAGPPGARARAAYSLGWLYLCLGRAFWGNPEGRRFFNESLGLFRESGDQRGIALSQVWLSWEGGVEGKQAWRLADESVALARQSGDPWAIALCLKVAYSHLRRLDKDLASRRAALEEAIALARKTEDPFLLSQALNGMGNVFAWVGELEAAEPWYRESLLIARGIDDTWSILDNINCLADGFLGLGRVRKAKELFVEGLGLAAEQGARAYLAWFLGGLCRVARYEGRSKRALHLAAWSESILAPETGYDPGFAQGLGLDEETAAAEWRKARSMTLEQAVGYALTDA